MVVPGYIDYTCVLPILHSNKKDIWIICKKGYVRRVDYLGYNGEGIAPYEGIKYDTYLLTENGIQDYKYQTYYFKDDEKQHWYDSHFAMYSNVKGDVLFDNEFYGFTNANDTTSKIYKFDRSIGAIVGEIEIDEKRVRDEWFALQPSSATFSLSGRKFYRAYSVVRYTLDSIRLNAYDLSYFNKASIEHSHKENTELKLGLGMQLANNHKIYMQGAGQNSLYCIENPGKPYSELVIKKCDLDFGQDTFRSRFPFFFHAYYQKYIDYDKPVCEGGELRLHLSDYLTDAEKKIMTNVLWTGPLGFSSTEKEPVISPVRREMEGWYYLSFILNSDEIIGLDIYRNNSKSVD